MRCPGCGSDNPPTDRYCGKCGGLLPAPSQGAVNAAEVERLLREANLARVRRDAATAESLCRKALQADPSQVGCYTLLADILWDTGRRDEAKDLLYQARQVAPNDASVQRRLDEWGDATYQRRVGPIRGFLLGKGDRWYQKGWFRLLLTIILAPIALAYVVAVAKQGPVSIAWFVLALVTSWYVYGDCGGGGSGVFWAIIMFFTFPLGLIVYWILRP